MRKTILFYIVSVIVFIIGLVLLNKIAVQDIESDFERVLVLIPSIINLFLIIYALAFIKDKENIKNTFSKIVFIIYYLIILFTFCISIIITVLLYFGITPKFDRFF